MGTTTYRYSGYTFMKTILVHAEGPLATCASGLSMLQKINYLTTVSYLFI